jgi:hypothetical protein
VAIATPPNFAGPRRSEKNYITIFLFRHCERLNFGKEKRATFAARIALEEERP